MPTSPSRHGVPAFNLLALAFAISAASTAAVIVFLPYFVAPSTPAATLGLALALFSLPALLVHPATYATRAPPRTLLIAAVGLDALAAGLFALAAPSAARPLAAKPAFPHALGAGLIAAGTASAILQAQLVAYITSSVPVDRLPLDLGIHLSVLEVASTSFAAAIPLLFVVPFALGLPLLYPFALLATALVILLPSLVYTLFFREKETSDLPQTSNEVSADVIPVADAPPILPVLLHPSALQPILAMFAASASTSFLRPLLSQHLLAHNSPPVLLALAFALIQMAILLTNNTSTLLTSYNRRLIITLSLLTAALSFRILANSHTTLATLTSLTILSSSTNTALVLTLADLADSLALALPSDPLMFVSYMAIAAGELTGVLIAAVLKDALLSFRNAVLAWSFFLGLVVATILLSEIPAIYANLRARASVTPPPSAQIRHACPIPDERQPLLQANGTSER